MTFLPIWPCFHPLLSVNILSKSPKHTITLLSLSPTINFKNFPGKIEGKKLKAGKLKVKYLDTEILSRESLTELPISWRHVVRGRGTPITSRDPEWKTLAHQHRVGLPVLSPVTAHAYPFCVCSFYAHPHYVPCSRHVRHYYQVEVSETVYREPHSPYLPAWNPVWVWVWDPNNQQTFIH